MAFLMQSPTRGRSRYQLLDTAVNQPAPAGSWALNGLQLHDSCRPEGFSSVPDCDDPVNPAKACNPLCNVKDVPVVQVEVCLDVRHPNFSQAQTDAEIRAELLRDLDLQASPQVERALANGAADSGQPITAPTFADAIVLGPAGAVDLMVGIGMLEQALADAIPGVEPTIHAPRGYASLLSNYLIRASNGGGNVIRTLLGSLVSFGAYPYDVTVGGITPADGEGWIFGTGPVGYVAGPVDVVRGETNTENRAEWSASRPIGVGWGCDTFAVHVKNCPVSC